MQQSVCASKNAQDCIVTVDTLLDTMQAGILLFGEKNEVLLANQSARSIVDSRRWLWLADNRLRYNGQAHPGLENAIRQATQGGGAGLDSPIVLHGENKHDFLLMGVTSIQTTSKRPAALCVLADPSQGLQPAVALLKAVYSMTDAEIDITSMIAEGFDYKKIASQRSVTVGTVRSFTKTIFKKLDVDSRAGVVHKVHAIMVSMNLLKTSDSSV